MGLSFGLIGLPQGLLGLLLTVLPARLERTSGDPLEGNIVAVEQGVVEKGSDEQVVLVLDQGGESLRVPFDELVSLVPQDVAPSAAPAMRVSLRDGSRIAVQTVALQAERLTIEPRRQEKLDVPLGQVASLRFQAPSPETDARWLGIAEQRPRGDLLVIRRSGGQLDEVSVVVESIADGQVRFSLGGDTANAPIDRLEGIVFGAPAGGAESDAVATVVDIHGSEWLIQRWLPGMVEEGIQIQLRGELTHVIPVDQVASIRFRSGLVSLVEQAPADQRLRLFMSSNVDGSLLQGWFGPRVEEGNNLLLVGGSSVTYRVEPGFNQFVGSVRRDPEVALAGEVIVRIHLDDRQVWEQALTNDETQGFELPLKQAGRIRLEVASGSDGDVGERVRFLRPRLVK